MRIKLALRPQTKSCKLPINYAHPLSAAIYKLLQNASPDYSRWLHHHGYLFPDGKPRKLFVFSKLFIQKRKIDEDFISIFDYSPIQLFISSPMLEDFIQNFVVGLFSSQQIEIGNLKAGAKLIVESVETIAPPEFHQTTKFKCLSPIVVSTKQEKQGRLMEHYYRPSDNRLSEAIRNNLIKKFETIYQRSPQNDHLEFNLDHHYFQARGGDRGLSKLIKIKQGTPQETRIKAFEAPFFLTGSAELMATAWECGIGNKNSMGFGMIENSA
ncbi:MAG TPA: CRISPR-associated endoribonuclease Cas6 [bacterium]|nr:CRISPR-associated endoribonuclease Cas6 [bacterium]